jgi:hypothetical protein
LGWAFIRRIMGSAEQQYVAAVVMRRVTMNFILEELILFDAEGTVIGSGVLTRAVMVVLCISKSKKW